MVRFPTLSVVCELFGLVMAKTLAVRGEFILVGDVMRSMRVIKYDAVAHNLFEVGQQACLWRDQQMLALVWAVTGRVRPRLSFPPPNMHTYTHNTPPSSGNL